MRVLRIASEGLGNGGIQNGIMNFCRNKKPEIRLDIVLFTKKRQHFDDEFERLGGTIFRIPNYEGKNDYRRVLDYYIRFLRIFWGVYRILKQHGPYDAIHCHNYFESGICTWAALLAGVGARISHSHNTVTPRKVIWTRRFYNFFLKILIQKTSNIRIGCSKQALRFLFDDDPEAFVINNTVDLGRFDREKYPYTPHENIRFIHIGRYCFQKNQGFLLEVFKAVKERLPDAELTLVGFGVDEDKIAQGIVELGLGGSVRMLPSDSNIPQLLSESDYFIFPSRNEGLGNVLLEAQVMDVKCFASTAVPPEANMGLCKYLDLNAGAQAWADEIVDEIEGDERSNRPILPDEVIKAYDIKHVSRIYEALYEGNVTMKPA